MEFRQGDVVVLGLETPDGRIVKAGKVERCSLMTPTHEDLIAAGYAKVTQDTPPSKPPKKAINPTATLMGLDYFSTLTDIDTPLADQKK